MKEKLMVKKTKVIAFRITEEEYEAIQAVMKSVGVTKFGNWIKGRLLDDICDGLDMLKAERKKAEAKAKRLAKKEAASGL
jgi:hypothetical protein